MTVKLPPSLLPTIKAILNDPVALRAVLVLACGLAVLAWAVRKWFLMGRLEFEAEQIRIGRLATAEGPPADLETSPEAPPPSPTEPADLTQQLVERFNQLTERIYILEKEKPETPTAEMAEKIEMLLNRLRTLEKIVQENTPQSATRLSDKDISMAFKALTDRIGVLDKAIQNLQNQQSASPPKREAI